MSLSGSDICLSGIEVPFLLIKAQRLAKPSSVFLAAHLSNEGTLFEGFHAWPNAASGMLPPFFPCPTQ